MVNAAEFRQTETKLCSSAAVVTHSIQKWDTNTHENKADLGTGSLFHADIMFLY